MSQHMKQLRMNPVRDAVFTSLYSDKRAQALNEFFKYGAEIYVLAGALRDAIAAHYEGEGDGTPRDFDIAVADISRGDFDTVLRAFGRRNRHGGYALRADGGLDWEKPALLALSRMCYARSTWTATRLAWT